MQKNYLEELIVNHIKDEEKNKDALLNEIKGYRKSEDYSKRELDIFFTDIKESLSNLASKLELVFTQTTETNGRVNGLEWWKNAIIWGAGVAVTVIGILIPVLYSYLTLQTNAQIQTTIDKTLSKYNITIK